MNLSDLGLAVSAGTDTDLPFVTDSWLRSYWPAWRKDPICYWPGHCDTLQKLLAAEGTEKTLERLYGREHRLLVTSILGSSRIDILHGLNDRDMISGYAVWSGNALHYVYMKQTVRKLGLATLLIGRPASIEYTHKTEVGELLLLKLGIPAIFSPEKAMGHAQGNLAQAAD